MSFRHCWENGIDRDVEKSTNQCQNHEYHQRHCHSRARRPGWLRVGTAKKYDEYQAETVDRGQEGTKYSSGPEPGFSFESREQYLILAEITGC